MFTENVKFLYTLCQKKCPYKDCKRVSKQVKKEGANKIFLIDRESNDDEDGKAQRKKSRDSTSRGESTVHPSTVAGDQTSMSQSQNPQSTTQIPPARRSKQKYLTPK